MVSKEIRSRRERLKPSINRPSPGAVTKMPDLEGDLKRCPAYRPYPVETRTPSQFLKQYNRTIGAYQNDPRHEIGRLLTILESSHETEPLVHTVEVYCGQMEEKKKLPNPKVVEQIFMDYFWGKSVQREMMKSFEKVDLNVKTTHMHAFARYWFDRLSELTLIQVRDPIKEIIRKFPEKFRARMERKFDSIGKKPSFSDLGNEI